MAPVLGVNLDVSFCLFVFFSFLTIHMFVVNNFCLSVTTIEPGMLAWLRAIPKAKALEGGVRQKQSQMEGLRFVPQLPMCPGKLRSQTL